MKIEEHDYAKSIETLVANVGEMLDSPNARERVMAIRHLAAGMEFLEHRVLLDAQASGMSWTEIGSVYGVTRQSVHRRFADETIAPADFFDQLLKELDEPAEVITTLSRAAERTRHRATTR
jgi:hypothetical protein